MKHIYIVWDDPELRYFKIGIASKPSERLSQFQVGSPKKFQGHSWKVNEADAIERLLHRAFRDKHLRGEWFELDLADWGVACQMLNSIQLFCECPMCDGKFAKNGKACK